MLGPAGPHSASVIRCRSSKASQAALLAAVCVVASLALASAGEVSSGPVATASGGVIKRRGALASQSKPKPENAAQVVTLSGLAPNRAQQKLAGRLTMGSAWHCLVDSSQSCMFRPSTAQARFGVSLWCVIAIELSACRSRDQAPRSSNSAYTVCSHFFCGLISTTLGLSW